ncbi:hypothetical protein BSKO_10562 [Bryopsis sp. KO-2023]|nr:hypothetical protein BSKO_10562 [Bryopsis sp. KO-2023]
MADGAEIWCLTPSDELSEDEFPGSLVDLENSLCQYGGQLEAFQKDMFDTLENVKEAVTKTRNFHTNQSSTVKETRSHGGDQGELACSQIDEAVDRDRRVPEQEFENLSSELTPVNTGQILGHSEIEEEGKSHGEVEREPNGEVSELHLTQTLPTESTAKKTFAEGTISAPHKEGKDSAQNATGSSVFIESGGAPDDEEKAGDNADIQNILSEVALLKETQRELDRENQQWEVFLKEEEARKKREEARAALQKELSEKFLKEARRHFAALRIARAWKAYRSERSNRRSSAATKIQSILRGLRSRKAVKKMAAQRAALEALEAAMVTRNRSKVVDAAKSLEKHGLASEANSRLEDFDKEASRCLQQVRGAAEHGRYNDFEEARTKAWAYAHLREACDDATRSFNARKEEIRQSLDAAAEGLPGAAFEVLRQQAEGVGITRNVLDEIAVALVERDQRCYESLIAAAKQDPFDGATFESCVFSAERLKLRGEIKEARRVLEGRRTALSQKLEIDVQKLKYASEIQKLLDEARRFGLIAANQGERILKNRQKDASDELLTAAASQSKIVYDGAMRSAFDLDVGECVLIEAARIMAVRVDACGKALKSAATAGSLRLMEDAGQVLIDLMGIVCCLVVEVNLSWSCMLTSCGWRRLEASKLELAQPLQEATTKFDRLRTQTIERITGLMRRCCEFVRAPPEKIVKFTDGRRSSTSDQGDKDTLNELHSVLESAKAMGLDEIHQAVPIILQVQNAIVESGGNVLVTSATNACDWEGRLDLKEWNEVKELPQQASDLIVERLPKGKAQVPLPTVHRPEVLSGLWQKWKAALTQNASENATRATLPSPQRFAASFSTASKRCPTGKQITEGIILNNSGGKLLSEIRSLDLGLEGLGSVKNLAEKCPNICDLYLNVNQLDTLEDIVQCSQLETLCIWENHLADTEGINGLQRLRSLSLNQNRISNLGSETWTLRFLTELSLANNNIQALDNRLIGCSALQRLDLSGNSISHIQGVCSCARLTYLDISRNRIESLEITRIDKLPFLPHLQQLFLQDNEIHESISLDALPNLKTLDLSFNAINTITALNFLGPLQQLATLNLSDNRVTLEEGYRESLSPVAVQTAMRRMRTGMVHFPSSLAGSQLHSSRIAQTLASSGVQPLEMGIGKGPGQIAETWRHTTLRHLISMQNARQKSSCGTMRCKWLGSSLTGDPRGWLDSCDIQNDARQSLVDLASDDLSSFQNTVFRSKAYDEQQQALHKTSAAAIQIQATFRGFCVRKRLQAALKAAKLIDEDDFDYSGDIGDELDTPWYLMEEDEEKPKTGGKLCPREAEEATQPSKFDSENKLESFSPGKVPGAVPTARNEGTVENERETVLHGSTELLRQSVAPSEQAKPGCPVVDAESRTKERMEARDQRKREKLETLMKEWGFKDMGTAEAYYKAQQKQKKQKQRKKRDQRLKDPQVRLQRLQEKVESGCAHQYTHRNPIKSQLQDRSQSRFAGERTLESTKHHPIGPENFPRNDENRKRIESATVESIAQPTCRSETGAHTDDTESESSAISRATEGDLVYFRSEIPNMKLWRRFMEEKKKKSGQRQSKMLVNNWADKNVGVEKKVDRGDAYDLGITGQNVKYREFGRR